MATADFTSLSDTLGSWAKAVRYRVARKKIPTDDLNRLFANPPTYRIIPAAPNSFCGGKYQVSTYVHRRPDVFYNDYLDLKVYSGSTLIHTAEKAIEAYIWRFDLIYKLNETTGLVIMRSQCYYYPQANHYPSLYTMRFFFIDPETGQISYPAESKILGNQEGTRWDKSNVVVYKNLYDDNIVGICLKEVTSRVIYCAVYFYKIEGTKASLLSTVGGGVGSSTDNYYSVDNTFYAINYRYTGLGISVQKGEAFNFHFFPAAYGHPADLYYKAFFIPAWGSGRGLTNLRLIDWPIKDLILGVYYVKPKNIFYVITFKEGLYDYSEIWYDTSGCFTIYTFTPPVRFTKTNLTISDIIYDIL